MESEPKFGLFQAVESVTATGTGVYRDRGVITGVNFQPPGYRDVMWWYQVTFYEPLESSPWVKTPYSELIAEDDLEVITE